MSMPKLPVNGVQWQQLLLFRGENSGNTEIVTDVAGDLSSARLIPITENHRATSTNFARVFCSWTASGFPFTTICLQQRPASLELHFLIFHLPD
jgi:hypothetical protein